MVYAASWNDQKVALKVPRSDLELTQKEQRRFLEEAQMLARVSHPSIVEVLDSGRLPDGRPYLAMSYCEGETLAARIERGGALPLDDALPLFEQLAAATTALHDEGLVHRDLKPENVFLVEDGTRVKLLDFGIAKEMAAKPSTTTQAGVARGTPANMAPERFFGSPASVATDVYELGVVFYMMVVGKLPWADTTAVDARLDPETPEQAGVDVPRRLSKELMRALSTRPERRPSTVAEFASAVTEARHSVEPAPESGGRVTAKTKSTSPPAAVVLDDPPPSSKRTSDAHVIESTPSPRKKPSTGRVVLVGLAGGLAVGLAIGFLRFGGSDDEGTPTQDQPRVAAEAPAAPPAPAEPPAAIPETPEARPDPDPDPVAVKEPPTAEKKTAATPPSPPKRAGAKVAPASKKPAPEKTEPAAEKPAVAKPAASGLPGGVYDKPPY